MHLISSKVGKEGCCNHGNYKRVNARHIVVSLIVAGALINSHATGVCAESGAGAPGTSAAEKARTAQAQLIDSAGRRSGLQGSVLRSDNREPHADTTSTKPVLQGRAENGVPLEWNGQWSGSTKLSPLAGKASVQHMRGAVAGLLLNIGADTTGEKHFEVSMRRLEGKIAQIIAAGDPDIHFWRDDKKNNLIVLNSAAMKINGASPFISGHTSVFNAGTIIGTQGYSPSRFGSSTISGGAPQSPQRNNIGGLNYGNGGVVFAGPTQCTCHYFK